MDHTRNPFAGHTPPLHRFTPPSRHLQPLSAPCYPADSLLTALGPAATALATHPLGLQPWVELARGHAPPKKEGLRLITDGITVVERLGSFLRRGRVWDGVCRILLDPGDVVTEPAQRDRTAAVRAGVGGGRV
eukprot:CAMPEP_0181253534 /NCGR_PEP_ID=MMETSP1096-20121128/48061_1 /TAXON_ID=156174 ORGANISM="Chrysochromulina ericina, Strain CCMP281" /NCGR_SAMPLE_ID=MMETSP1096 /ASSEMBLY_ACC=CAM_ASM_000453 /LENGTH=132 /DNA_ID=CAMNT_0023351389 /DNA_START=435 /DNA_END=833 /DNA_ORIENTATION=-